MIPPTTKSYHNANFVVTIELALWQPLVCSHIELHACFSTQFDRILPKRPYPPCLRMADRALLAGYPRMYVYPLIYFYLPDALNVICVHNFSIPVSVVLSCADGVIDLTYADWGRSQPYNTVCPLPIGIDENTNCHHSIADEFSACHGATSCIVPDVIGTVVDPCFGTAKYIQILYFCTPGKTMASLNYDNFAGFYPNNRFDVFCSWFCGKLWRAGTSNYTPQVLWDVIACPCPSYLLLGPISLTIFPSQFRFDGNFIKLLFNYWWLYRNKIWHMPRQPSCRAMCQIL